MADQGIKLRSGFTTGTCAAAAAKAAAFMLLSGGSMAEVSVEMPTGDVFSAPVLEVERSSDFVSCAVKKDAGDDPDVTDGLLVYAKVSFFKGEPQQSVGMIADVLRVNVEREEVKSGRSFDSCGQNRIEIDGGEGIGRVTMPGLDQPVGAAAINSVPRRMIRESVEEVCRLLDFCGKLSVVIFVPGGEAVAKQTMNRRLGIVGGISILGTTGIVSPMSTDALLAAVRLEIRQKKALGAEILPLAIGNYGRQFLQEKYGFDIDAFVKCSNFIGEAIRLASEEGFDQILLVGHIGKLIKVAGGKLNTHSKYGDARMETLAAALIECGGTAEAVRQVLECVSTEEALRIVDSCGLLAAVMQAVLEKIEGTFNSFTNNNFRALTIRCVVFSNVFGVLGMSDGADKMLEYVKESAI